ncbi:MAG: DNA polymerase III subunit alpha [Desulfobacteraceae bacterium 4572_87]|nr:MAG: DNA polymerase III subunit alpha [Desulfobacteraceae bacterium 4572_87]
MSDSPFVHLHVHTEYSLLDGAIRIDRMLDKSKAQGMGSVAITDHGNMFGVVDFFDRTSKAGIKPIIGCEVYVAPGDRRDRTPSPNGRSYAYHLVLLVMNDQGYKNLSTLVTLGHLEGFYYRPRVDMALLREYNHGLVALSACLAGHIPYLINTGKMEAASQKAQEMASIFNQDRFFLELQANKMVEQEKVNRGLRELSKDLSIPMVATNDCHYLNREDSEAHDVLLCIQTGKSVDEEKRLRFSSDEFYFKTRAEMEEALPDDTEALDNTAHVAGLCQYEMRFGEYKFPVFQVPGNQSLDDMLMDEARKGLETRLVRKEDEEGPMSPELRREYEDRLQYELKIILKMGFAGYFLIVADFIDYALNHDIAVGPGRGSAAGSLVAFCLNITNIEPIKYGLIFERFLNPARISMPDIDIDFCIHGRDQVIQYVAEKYGRNNVSQIITFGTMKARGVIRDVGRTLNVPLSEVDRIAKLVPEGPGVKLDQAIREEPELKSLENGSGTSRKLLSISRSLEGLARHASTHACGVVISDRPLTEYLPLYKGSKGEIMAQFTMDKVEQLGLIKFDFLGLKTLTVLKEALKLVEASTGRKIDLDRISLEDKATYQLCSDGKTTGVFQLESSGIKEILRKLSPETFEDVIALVALYRPGPLGSNMVDDFINGKHGKIKVSYFLPQLKPILKETYGVILYQEQVMQIAQVLANYTMAEADELRKAVGKKKPEVLAKHRARFIDGSKENNVKAGMAEKLFGLIEKFGGYGFNKSHSAAYAMIAYQTAYLKAHYPVQFMCSLLTQDMGNQDKTIKNIAECRTMGIKILPPDVNESHADFSVVEDQIRFGLAAVKNVGLKAVELVIAERDAHGHFGGLLDFCRRMEGSKVNRRVLEGLIQCGAFDFTKAFRSRLFEALDDALRLCGAKHDPNQLNMFGSIELGEGQTGGLLELPDLPEWDEKEKLRREKEALGFYITGHPLDSLHQAIERFSTCLVHDLPTQKDKDQVKLAGVVESLKLKRTKRGDKMAIMQLEDLTGSTEVVIFPDVFADAARLLTGDEPLLVSGTVEIGDNSAKVIAKEIKSLHGVELKAARVVIISLEKEKTPKEVLEGLKDAVFKYPGDCRLMFKVGAPTNNPVMISAHFRYSILPCPQFFGEVESLLGGSVYEVVT